MTKKEWFVKQFPHFIYKAYDICGVLLYVGVTYDMKTRMRVHKRTSPWWNEHVYMEYAKYPNRDTAVIVERDLILQEMPAYNVQKYSNKGR